MSSSFRNHRVVVASLFLPSTVILGDSLPSTPDTDAPPHPPITVISETAFKDDKPSKTTRPTLTHKATGSISAVAGKPPIRSIIEDLKDRSRLPSPTTTPANEQTNPFLGLTRPPHSFAAAPTVQVTAPRGTGRKGSFDVAHLQRLQRKHSRSSSRRQESGAASSPGRLFNQQWHIEYNSHCNGGLKNAVQSVSDKLRKKLWVGTLGTQTDDFSESLRADVDRRMLQQSNSLPVWVPDADFDSCYDEFCHQVLWPALHYAVPDAPKTKLFYESASFKQYVAVNQAFADLIAANYQEGDIIWINDYHLMLVPAMLREKASIPPHAAIGFFMHVAFPSSEIFRCLAVREKLLRGVLGADLVGFQTANYTRHFRQTVSRILGLEALPKGISLEIGGSKFVDVGAFPMGIDVGALREKKQDPEVADWVQLLKQRYANMKVLVGRDKLDEIQGVRQKIQAFEIFLTKHPEFQGKAVLIQVALPTTESNEHAGGVADMVSHINSKFSTLTYQPVVFLHTQDLTFSQYLALLTFADAFLVTSLREGMALRTHEFVECQEERHRPLILSEFTGSYSYSGFRSCIAVNPWDNRSTAAAIYQALTMSDEEATSRWEDLHNHVNTQTAQAFVTSFLTRVLRANGEHLRADSDTVVHLDTARIAPRYRHSSKRLILVDLEGTLWERDLTHAGLKAQFIPDEAVVNALKRLTEDKRNQVWLLSGLPVKDMMEKYTDALPALGAIAENGCFLKPTPTRRQPSPKWLNMVANFNMTWKPACIEMLHYFSERTPGSFVEEREASIVWRYWTGAVDESSPARQWARRQAAEAQNHIFDSLGERYGLRIIPGRSSFLILPNNVSRASAVAAILQPGGAPQSPLSGKAAWMAMEAADLDSAGNDLDFILAIGTDERLLRRLNDIDGSETCSTSGKATEAKWQLDPSESIDVLKQLAKASQPTMG